MSNVIYRLEHARSNRAGCQNSACKREKIKIGKGEPRMGSLVTLPPRYEPTWMWKHWGCVTPLQIKNIQDMVEGLDLDTDLDVLDGWDEIDEDFREKIKHALRLGHVADEDWRGSPELNRPGMKGINKRTPKKQEIEASDEEGPVDSPSKLAPKKQISKKRKAASDLSENEEPAPKPKKKSTKKKAKVESDLSSEDDDEPVPRKTTARTKAKAEAAKAVKEEQDVDEDVKEPAPKKKSKAKGMSAKAVKKEEDRDDEIPAPAPMRKGRARLKHEAEVNGDEPVVPAQKPKRATKSKKQVKAEPEQSDEAADVKDEPEAGVNPKSKRGRKVKMEDIEDASEMPIAPPVKAERGRKVKKEVSPDPEPEPEVNGASGDEGLVNVEAVDEPHYPVIAQTDGPADMDVKPRPGRGRKIKKEEVVDSIEAEEDAKPVPVKKERKGSKVKREPNLKTENGVDETEPMAVAVPTRVKREKTASKVKAEANVKMEDLDEHEPESKVKKSSVSKGTAKRKKVKKEA